MTAPSDETSPLLNGSISSASVTHTARDAAYARFSPAQKRVIVMLVSCSSLLPSQISLQTSATLLIRAVFASGSFIPAMPQIARDLDSTGPVISYAVSLSIFGAALGGMIFATYSSYYGRRPVYLFGLPLLCLGSLGVSRSSTIPALMCFRFIQAFGTSGGISVGGGVIGDVYPLTERGSALGIFFAASLVGNAIAPIVGGWGARYSSWRNVQLGILALGLAVFLGMLFFLPETAHPGSRGIEKDKASSGNDTGKWVWLNPFSCLWLLRSPNIMFVTLTSLTVLYTDYALLVPIAYTVGKSYNITNEAIIGACFFPMGLGNLSTSYSHLGTAVL
ncbi:unnamed protein product [Mycena citricolor]|uniref:Major facilitator superfamily (MFS) profile domain-containing protein n=1 Tax=Mycena citricolor TaxID=2018698 RepID=A0AAD2HTX4_9AGAR|nr:unnamed protein product [Mycena citricolor]